jgi:hypothetical protein
MDPAGIEKQRSPPDYRKLMVNLEIIEVGIPGDNFLQ